MTDDTRNVHVEAYSGGRSPESPRAVIVNGKRHVVSSVDGAWRECRRDNGDIEEHFEVTLPEYGECEIVYNHQWDNWTMKEPKKKGA